MVNPYEEKQLLILEHISSGRTSIAIQLTEEILSEGDGKANIPLICLLQAEAYRKEGDTAKANRAMQRGLESDPDNPGILYSMMRAFFDNKQYIAVSEYADRIVASEEKRDLQAFSYSANFLGAYANIELGNMTHAKKFLLRCPSGYSEWIGGASVSCAQLFEKVLP